MILPGETEAGSAGKQPSRGIVRRAHRDDQRPKPLRVNVNPWASEYRSCASTLAFQDFEQNQSGEYNLASPRGFEPLLSP